MKRYIIIIFLFAVLSVYCQNADRAARLFADGEYAEAQELYSKLLLKSPKNQLYLYRFARCADELGQKEVAIDYFERAGEKYVLRNYYLGLLYADAYRFAEATAYLASYIATIDTAHANYRVTDSVLNYSRKAERMLSKTRDIMVIDSTIVPKKDFLNAYKLSKASGKITASKTQEGLPAITYLTNRGDQKLLSQNDEKQHIYRQEKQFDLWVHKTPLPSPVNDNYNSAFPFLLSDGFTLYFSSDRAEGLGGLDIYYTLFDDENNSYLQPVNIGMPFNSSANDYMLAIDETEGVGYFSTDRRTTADSVCVYKFKYETEPKYLKSGVDGVNDTIIRYRAQMRDLKMSVAEQPKESLAANVESVPSTDIVQKKNEFCFVLNDSTIYYFFDDFKHTEARTLYRRYLSECEKLKLLQNKRKEYSVTIDSLQRLSLASEILNLEEQLLMNDSTDLLNQIRRLEQVGAE